MHLLTSGEVSGHLFTIFKNSSGSTFVKRLASLRPLLIHGRSYQGTLILDTEFSKYFHDCANAILFFDGEANTDWLTKQLLGLWPPISITKSIKFWKIYIARLQNHDRKSKLKSEKTYSFSFSYGFSSSKVQIRDLRNQSNLIENKGEPYQSTHHMCLITQRKFLYFLSQIISFPGMSFSSEVSSNQIVFASYWVLHPWHVNASNTDSFHNL